jgi:uncharacterized protein YaaN involved in tellurite resistance
LNRISFYAISTAVLFLFGTGCLVTKSSYDIKVAESDSLRSALAELNREKAKLAEKNAELLQLEADCREREADLAEQIREMDRSLKRLSEGLTGPYKADEKRLTIREQFIENLIESEKAVERRIEELAARAQACEKELSLIQNRMP